MHEVFSQNKYCLSLPSCMVLVLPSCIWSFRLAFFLFEPNLTSASESVVRSSLVWVWSFLLASRRRRRVKLLDFWFQGNELLDCLLKHFRYIADWRNPSHHAPFWMSKPERESRQSDDVGVISRLTREGRHPLLIAFRNRNKLQRKHKEDRKKLSFHLSTFAFYFAFHSQFYFGFQGFGRISGVELLGDIRGWTEQKDLEGLARFGLERNCSTVHGRHFKKLLRDFSTIERLTP